MWFLPKMRVVFAHALHFLHFLHSHAFTCITTALQLRSLIAFRCICIFCILRVFASRCIMQYLHFLHFARDCISLHYAIFAFVAFARDCISLHYMLHYVYSGHDCISFAIYEGKNLRQVHHPDSSPLPSSTPQTPPPTPSLSPPYSFCISSSTPPASGNDCISFAI